MRWRIPSSYWWLRGVCCLVIFLILSDVATGITSPKPPKILSTEEDVFIRDDRVIRAGSTLRLTCLGERNVTWKVVGLPEELASVEHAVENRTEIQYAIPTATSDDYRYESTLIIEGTIHMDTGYYACHYQDAGDINNPQVAARTYVFVQDDERLIVSYEKDAFIFVTVYQSTRSVIPCKPTHPDVEMSLTIQEDEANNVTHLYDPREGFILTDPTVHDHGTYECEASYNGTTEKRDIFINVGHKPSVAPKPHINDNQATYLTRGDRFSLNCSVEYEDNIPIELTWKIPDPQGFSSGRITVSQIIVNSHSRQASIIHVAYKLLTVSQAQTSDNGVYECTSAVHTEVKQSESILLTIHDPSDAYVHLTPQSTSAVIEENAGSTVWWVVNFKAYPKPTFEWYTPNNETITMSSKYELSESRSSATIKIHRIRQEDAGIYRLTAYARNDVSQSLNFSLKVKGKPSVVIKPDSVKYHHKESFNFTCRVYSNGKADIALSFRECPPAENCTGPWLLNEFINKSKSLTWSGFNKEVAIVHPPEEFKPQIIMIKGLASRAGQYNCSACTSNNCSSSLTRIDVMDFKDEFEVLAPSDNPVEGDEYYLVCGIARSKLKNGVLSWSWTSFDGKVIPINDKSLPPGAKLRQDSTFMYSYAERLEWARLSVKASGRYTCTVQWPTGTEERVKAIEIASERSPVITAPEEQFIYVEQGNVIELRCDFDGLPAPKIEWTKDGQPIDAKTSDHSTAIFFEYAKRENAGTYRCTATNRVASSFHEFFVSVNEPDVHKGVIVAIVLIIGVVIVLVAILIKKLRDEKKRKAFFREHQLDNFDKGNPDSINPELPVDEQTELLPYDRDNWEFPRERLKLGKQLGAGAFGRVLKGEATGIIDAEPVTTVAVKMVRSQGNMLALKALASELKIMIHLGSHLNVVNVLGACTKKFNRGELLVIVEYCRYGNIQDFLVRHREAFINQVNVHGRLDPRIGAEILARSSALTEYDVPRSPLGVAPNSANYILNGSIERTTEMSSLSLTPTCGGTAQSDLVPDTGPTFSRMDSVQSNASSGNSQPNWRSDYRGDYRDHPVLSFCTKDLLCWAYQISRGMNYLASRKVLHGDLAARNILLADDHVVKIADFGLAREMYRSGHYKKKGDGPLPIKWMAIESIVDQIFSTQSDVWSFGVVLWELFSLGKTPYPGLSTEDFFRKLLEGYRMEKPRYATNDIYDVMDNCWKADPKERPSFQDLEDILGDQIEASVRQHYIDLNDPYDRANALRTNDYLVMKNNPNYVNVEPQSTPTYVNMAPDGIPRSPNRTSDVSMNGYCSPGIPIPVSRPVTDGYLMMTSPPGSITPKSGGPGRGSNKFNFEFGSQLRRVEEEPSDQMEMQSMLNNLSPAAGTGGQANHSINWNEQGEGLNAFSNPNYQMVNAKHSDLDNLSATPSASPELFTNDQGYINLPPSQRNPRS